MTDRVEPTPTKPEEGLALVLAGCLLGLSVPGLVFGKAAMAPFAGLALIGFLYGILRNGAWRAVLTLSRSGLAHSIWAFLAILTLCTLLSLDRAESVEILLRVGASLLVGWICLRGLVWSGTALRFACLSLVIGGVIAFSIAVFGVYFQSSAVAFREGIGMTGPYNGPKNFKLFASATICFLPVLLWAAWWLGGKWRLAVLPAVPLAGLVVYGDGVETSYSALFGVIGGAGLLFLVLIGLKTPVAVRRGIILAVLGMGGVLAFYVLSNLPPPPVEADQAARLPVPDWHRQVIWGFAWDVFLKNPVFGIGPNTINLVPGASDIIPGMNQEYVPGHPHNSVLEIAAEAGIVGLVGLAALIICLLRGFLRFAVGAREGRYGTQVRKELFGAAMAGIFLTGSFWTSSLSNFSIWSAWWIATFIVLISIPLAACIRAAKQGKTE